MKKETKQISIFFVLSLVLSFLTSRLIGKTVYGFLKPVSGLGPQMQCPECFDGFIISYLFFISLFINFIATSNKIKIWLVFLLPIIIFINPPFEFLITSVCFIIIAWLLAQGILLVYKEFKKT